MFLKQRWQGHIIIIKEKNNFTKGFFQSMVFGCCKAAVLLKKIADRQLIPK